MTMNMKKKAAPLLAAALVAANAAPVMAVDYQDVTGTQQTGNTTVVANVNATDSGNVTYTISVPSKVDFGDLQRSADIAQRNNKELTGDVTLTTVDDLDTATQRIAVLVQDAKNGTDGFRIYGVSGTASSNGKYLNYDILADGIELNNTNLTPYDNGFVVGAFAAEGNTVPLKFSLDQNQMTGELDQWAGKYQGTLTFYSKVAAVGDYN